jgi:hypothetical protein
LLGRLVGLGLALVGGLAGHHRQAAQLVQRLLQREVLGAAELGQRLGRLLALGRLLLELLARFLAGLLARSSFFSSAPCRCFSRSASRMRSAAKTLPSAVSSSQTSGTMPLAWMLRPPACSSARW